MNTKVCATAAAAAILATGSLASARTRPPEPEELRPSGAYQHSPGVGARYARAPAITPSSIAGATLGLTAAGYRRLLGAPSRLEKAKGGDLGLPGFQQPDGWSRLVFPRRKLEVYFDGGTRSVLVTTWNRAFRTTAGIGPCSTVAQLRKAYGSKLKPSAFNTQRGRVCVYTLGDLLFAAADLVTVTAVGLYDSKAPGAQRKGGSLAYAGFVIQPPDQVSCS